MFTGGVGEGSAPIRERATQGLSFLGIALDADANADPQLDAEVGAAGAGTRTFVIVAREDLQIARDVRRVLSGGERV